MGMTEDGDRLSTRFEQLTVTELTLAIHETILSKEDKRIAELRYIELETIERIAEIVMLDKRTVRKRLIRILPRLSWTVEKLLK
jgi:DNA-directed RNA polymerase specialized sigma24 family protein